MIFRINTNIASINAQRHLSQNDTILNRSMERLSSGLRINRAADDAMGLYISESLRADLTGLKQVSRNAGQAASMIQTAEGGYEEIGDILSRLKELAVQAQDGTISDTDRKVIDTEADELVEEIERIADYSNYNGIPLLNGTGGPDGDGKFTFPMGAEDGNKISVMLESAKAIDLGMKGGSTTVNHSDLFTDTTTPIGTLLGLPDAPDGTVKINDIGITINLKTDSLEDIRTAINAAMDPDIAVIEEVEDGGTTKYRLVLGGDNEYIDDNGVLETLGFIKTTSGIDLKTADSAADAIGVIDTAINSVNTYRSDIGAFQNRLDYAISNINATIENTMASDSVIRDADIATEMAEMTRAQMLIQAGTSMLAQANLMPQNALALLP